MAARARAQQADRVRRIGVLIGIADDAEGQARLAAFQKGMQELGWNEGREIQMGVRFTAGTAERARTHAAELVAMAPDAILANTGAVVSSALRQQTQSIPIVFAQVVDPVSSGFVESLARPGGNITGFLSLDFGMGATARNIKEVAPRVTRVGVLRELTIPGGTGTLGAIQAAASSLRVEAKALDVRDAATIERGVSAFHASPTAGWLSWPIPPRRFIAN